MRKFIDKTMDKLKKRLRRGFHLPKLTAKRTGLVVLYDYRKWRFKILYAGLILLMVIVLFIMVFPPVWLIVSSFKTAQELYRVPFAFLPDTFNLEKVTDIWNMLGFTRYYINSVVVTAGAVLAAVLFNGLLAYAISVVKPAGHKIIFALIMASLMIPPILNMGTLFNYIVRLGMINSLIPLALVFGANPFYFIMFKTYFDRLPKVLFEAAQIDGASKLQTFRHVLMPMSKPIIGVVSIFTITAAWSDFLLPFLVLQQDNRQTVMVKIYQLYSDMGAVAGFGPDMLLMVMAFSIVPPVILFFIFQRQITAAVATTGIRE